MWYVSCLHNVRSNTYHWTNAHFCAYGLTVGIGHFGEAKRTLASDSVLACTAAHAFDLVHTRIARITHVRFDHGAHVVALQNKFAPLFRQTWSQQAEKTRFIPYDITFQLEFLAKSLRSH